MTKDTAPEGIADVLPSRVAMGLFRQKSWRSQINHLRIPRLSFSCSKAPE